MDNFKKGDRVSRQKSDYTTSTSAYEVFCSICGEPVESEMTETKKELFKKFNLYSDIEVGQFYHTVCQCEINRQNKEREKANLRARIESMRKRGIADTLSQNMRFENDLGIIQN
jgi:hypothetical protein